MEPVNVNQEDVKLLNQGPGIIRWEKFYIVYFTYWVW